MARENLLEERRAGARQSDDEDRLGGKCAVAAAIGKELTGKERLAAADVLGKLARKIADALLAQSIALRVLLERLGVGVRVLEGLAEREMQVIAILLGKVRARLLSAHRGEIIR